MDNAQRNVLFAKASEPLAGVITRKNGEEEAHYFVIQSESGTTGEPSGEPIKLAGVWADLDEDEVLDALDRIRHESVPTPPITSL